MEFEPILYLLNYGDITFKSQTFKALQNCNVDLVESNSIGALNTVSCEIALGNSEIDSSNSTGDFAADCKVENF